MQGLKSAFTAAQQPLPEAVAQKVQPKGMFWVDKTPANSSCSNSLLGAGKRQAHILPKRVRTIKGTPIMQFGEIRQINVREIWENEATKFTPWLEKNIEKLGEALGMELEVEQREADVGDFSLDLLVKDLGTNRVVIIENQFNSTDHNHLGKLLTYAAGFDAGVVIWISETIRDEHRQALEWLNQKTDSETDFFGVVIEVFKIDDSKPAFKFNPVVLPNEWQKGRKGNSIRKVSEKSERYQVFFQSLIDALREKHKFTNARLGQPQSWYSFSSGLSGVVFSACFAQGGRTRVEVYIDVHDKEENKRIFDSLFQEREKIETTFGENLEWERLENKRAVRIALYRDGSIESDNNALNSIEGWMIEKLLKFKKIFPNFIKKYL